MPSLIFLCLIRRNGSSTTSSSPPRARTIVSYGKGLGFPVSSGRNNRAAAGSPLGKDYYPTTDCNGVFFSQPSVPVTPLNSISEYMLLPFVYNIRQVPPVHYFCAAFQLYDFFFLSENLLEMNPAGEQ